MSQNLIVLDAHDLDQHDSHRLDLERIPTIPDTLGVSVQVRRFGDDVALEITPLVPMGPQLLTARLTETIACLRVNTPTTFAAA